MIPSPLRSLLRATFASDIPAIEAVNTIFYMEISIRKAFLTLCQTQSMPDPETTVALRLGPILQKPFEAFIDNSGIRYATRLQEVIQPLRYYIQSPVLSGLLTMLVKNMPMFDIESARETFEKGLSKEIEAAMEEYHPTRLNWNAVLSHDRIERRHQPFHREYGHRTDLKDFIYHSIAYTIPRLIRRPLYPVIGNKTIGVTAFRDLQDAYVGYPFDEEDITPSIACVERLYSISGRKSVGITELRWSWKYGQLKPRIYYARGPTVYHSSKYIQPIFNVLVDALPVTHRRERFDARSVQLADELRLFIYDYESFTSLFEEIKNFNLALANFFRGTRITIIDTHLGPIEVDLGDLFMDYHEVCSLYPEFDISSCNWDRIRTEIDPVAHSCGMLGVPGNISSCTLAHGIHLIMVLEDLGCKVVGDDAIGASLEGPDEVLMKLRNIGRIQEDKVESWYGESREPDQTLEIHTWHYTKRPILRLANHVIQGYQMDFFPVADFLQLSDQFHTVKPHHDRAVFLKQRRNILLSFVVRLRRLPETPGEVELETLERFYDHVRHLLYKEKETIRDDTVALHILPSCVLVSYDFDEWFEEFKRIITWVPREIEGEIEPFDKKGVNLGLMTQSLNLAIKLKYAQADMVMVQVVPEDDKEFFQRLILRTDPLYVAYTFSLFPSCPLWLVDLIDQERSGEKSFPIVEQDAFAYAYEDSDDEI
jgi:hypothetical protein